TAKKEAADYATNAANTVAEVQANMAKLMEKYQEYMMNGKTAEADKIMDAYQEEVAKLSTI
ncbi:MAG: hypothetical protein AAGJ83_08630, partial [Planctomycetota bacterium]